MQSRQGEIMRWESHIDSEASRSFLLPARDLVAPVRRVSPVGLHSLAAAIRMDQRLHQPQGDQRWR